MRILLFVPVLIGCRKLPDAPQELDELCAYLFEHANDEPESLTIEAGALNLDVWLDARIEETSAGYAVNTLSDEAVNALNDGERSLEGVRGAAVGYTHTADLETLLSTLVDVEPSVIYPETYLSFERTFDGDVQCFLDGDCLSLQSETFSSLAYPLDLQLEVNSIVQYRWVDTEDLGRVAVERTWMRQEAGVSLDWLSVEQQYYVWVFIPNNEAAGARSIQATWMVAGLGNGGVPEDIVLNLVVDSMVKGAEELDAYITAN